MKSLIKVFLFYEFNVQDNLSYIEFRRFVEKDLSIALISRSYDGLKLDNVISTIREESNECHALVFFPSDSNDLFIYSLGFGMGVSLVNTMPVLFICQKNLYYDVYKHNVFMLSFDELKCRHIQDALIFYFKNEIDNFWIQYANFVINQFNAKFNINLEIIENYKIIDALKNDHPNNYSRLNLDIIVAKLSTNNFLSYPDLSDSILASYYPHVVSHTTQEHPKIRIFLASSCELCQDRDDFELYFLRENKPKQGYYLEIIRWENFLDAMSETRLQDEYNKAICDCDIFVSLFFTKTGKYTEEEFDVAHRKFLQTKKPRIYTFFKNADVKMGNVGDEVLSLLSFKKKLGELGHFYTGYDNIEHLQLQFKDQLEKLLDNGL